MTWNVYRYDSNAKTIRIFNIFNHSSFSDSVAKLKKKKISKEEFSKRLRREAMYYFWSKYEHEVVVTTFPPYIDQDELERIVDERYISIRETGNYPRHMNINPEIGIKIDIYTQLFLNWDAFADYVRRAKE